MKNLTFHPATREDRIVFNRVINDSDFYCEYDAASNCFVFPEGNDVDALEMEIRNWISENYADVEIYGHYESEDAE